MKTPNPALASAIHSIYAQFPNLSYRPRPDDVKLLAAFIKSQHADYPPHLDLLLAEDNHFIEGELNRYHHQQTLSTADACETR
ncbi:hypothetical protein ACFFLZ_02450 [Photobacterium aphoticum]|uniref:Uncharacterized protein n=1 Tax=Photobacterium aphoticum TaxID=754436 RepID=A0A0J1GTQ2_9GAMM|nr:hypothetical protein [Photobacterium aphoticum]KLV03046.1 hypothetical protein ABT58_00505 [Photobacterium aphoticum]PSU57978.1 hypothetical protein C9I90_07855 [Photobacterium aphoticum]GHA60821.1 hypothetical protein GCM10007086_38310 [Photobacterium aphoticum]